MCVRFCVPGAREGRARRRRASGDPRHTPNARLVTRSALCAVTAASSCSSGCAPSPPSDAAFLVYATGHESRVIGLVNKLLSYVEQYRSADTHVRQPDALDSRLRLEYSDAAVVLGGLRVRSVRLLTNNPAKVYCLRASGVHVVAVEPLATAPHSRNVAYLRTKEHRLCHVRPSAAPSLTRRLPATSRLRQRADPLSRRTTIQAVRRAQVRADS